MITGLHFLLTYACNYECDHCFVYSSSEACGTFTIKQLREVLNEAEKIGTIEWIYFEGGEAFLYYPIMIEGLRLAKQMGFKTGIVTNAYWATTEEDAELWLKPLKDLDLADLSLSDDEFHSEEETTPAQNALAAAKKLGMPVKSICIDKPQITVDSIENKGAPVVDGGALLKGRAVDKLTEGLPTRSYREFTECPKEDLRNPKRVHLDAFGNVHLCQGITMGNMWEVPLHELVENYNPDAHAISGPLLEGGPKLLAEKHQVPHEEEYVSECHFCYLIRKALIDDYSECLGPRQVYGIE